MNPVLWCHQFSHCSSVFNLDLFKRIFIPNYDASFDMIKSECSDIQEADV